ncbi:hypothetical protein EON68_03465, partial [archaeon]
MLAVQGGIIVSLPSGKQHMLSQAVHLTRGAGGDDRAAQLRSPRSGDGVEGEGDALEGARSPPTHTTFTNGPEASPTRLRVDVGGSGREVSGPSSASPSSATPIVLASGRCGIAELRELSSLRMRPEFMPAVAAMAASMQSISTMQRAEVASVELTTSAAASIRFPSTVGEVHYNATESGNFGSRGEEVTSRMLTSATMCRDASETALLLCHNVSQANAHLLTLLQRLSTGAYVPCTLDGTRPMLVPSAPSPASARKPGAAARGGVSAAASAEDRMSGAPVTNLAAALAAVSGGSSGSGLAGTGSLHAGGVPGVPATPPTSPALSYLRPTAPTSSPNIKPAGAPAQAPTVASPASLSGGIAANARRLVHPSAGGVRHAGAGGAEADAYASGGALMEEPH